MTICFEGKRFELLPDETVLEGIERQGCNLPAFCRRGICQTCLVKATQGSVPPAAQRGLKDGQRRQSLFLACLCRPSDDLSFERHGSAAKFTTRIERVVQLSERVLGVWLALPEGFQHEAGQFVQLERSDGLIRSYSIASLPGEPLELHVALLPGGAMSHWLKGAAGQSVALRGPFGECFYVPDEPDRPLYLAGTGTGLAPLLGVVRAALAAKHGGPIHLYHGSRQREGLYLWEQLEALARDAPGLALTGSVLDPPDAGSQGCGCRASFESHAGGRCPIQRGALDEAVLASDAPWGDARAYLCGDYELVRQLQKKLYLAGVPLARIHTDAFVAPAQA